MGSTLSGFGSNASDVDMCLVYSGKNCPIYLGNDLRIQSAKILKDFEEQLQKIGTVHSMNKFAKENLNYKNYSFIQKYMLISI